MLESVQRSGWREACWPSLSPASICEHLKGVRLRYRLDGFDKNWTGSELGSRSDVHQSAAGELSLSSCRPPPAPRPGTPEESVAGCNGCAALLAATRCQNGRRQFDRSCSILASHLCCANTAAAHPRSSFGRGASAWNAHASHGSCTTRSFRVSSAHSCICTWSWSRTAPEPVHQKQTHFLYSALWNAVIEEARRGRSGTENAG